VKGFERVHTREESSVDNHSRVVTKLAIRGRLVEVGYLNTVDGWNEYFRTLGDHALPFVAKVAAFATLLSPVAFAALFAIANAVGY
jgi:hypothetical protein